MAVAACLEFWPQKLKQSPQSKVTNKTSPICKHIWACIRDLTSVNKVEEHLKKIPDTNLGPPHARTHTHKHAYIYVNTHTHIHMKNDKINKSLSSMVVQVCFSGTWKAEAGGS